MKDKIDPFKCIRIVEDICKAIQVVPEDDTFKSMENIAVASDDWDAIVPQLLLMLPQLKLLAVEPLTQMGILHMLDAVHTQLDAAWCTPGNRKRELYLMYRSSFLHIIDLDAILPRDYGIDTSAA
jgi:hypothetical protein